MSEQIIKTVALSSLHKVYPDFCPEDSAIKSFSTMKNEPLSVQVAYKSTGQRVVGINVRITTDLPISLYCIDYVPVVHSDVYEAGCTRAPGLHLEGPYFSGASSKSKGAQKGDLLRDPDYTEMQSIFSAAKGTVLRWDAAPELPNADLKVKKVLLGGKVKYNT